MKLHPYQRKAVEFALAKKQAYMALDMGLGKTAIALEFIRRCKQPAIVFGPLQAIRSTWPEEIAKWTPELTFKILHGSSKTLRDHEKYNILLINYEGLKWLSMQPYSFKPRIFIFDEASMIKSHSTQRFKLLRRMAPLMSEYRLALSATPAPNSLHDLWAQYQILVPPYACGLGKNITAFRRRFCRAISYPGLRVVKYEVEPTAYSVIYKTIAPITYRLAAKDYLSMPKLIQNRYMCKLNTKARKAYKEFETEFILELKQTEIEAATSVSLGMKLRQFMQGGVYDEDSKWHKLHDLKLKALQDIIERAAGQPILCAVQFRGELAQLRAKFPTAGVIAGGTKAKEADSYIRAWNAGKLQLLLCHPASLSHGVNLQAGGHIIVFLGLPWSYEQYMQLIGRLYRQGQQKAVVVHHVLIKDSIDEHVYKALKSKEKGQAALLNYLREVYL